MKFKTFVLVIGIALMSFVASPSGTFASNTAPVANSSVKTDPGDDEKFANIVKRVNEIQEMDKSNLIASEKKALRKELQGLKKEASGLDSKVYLSVGAIIIIILLLILILR